MTATDMRMIADSLVKRDVTTFIIAALILVQKNAVRVSGQDSKGQNLYAYTGNGQSIDRRWIVALGKRGLVEMWAGQPRLTTAGTTHFYRWVNGR